MATSKEMQYNLLPEIISFQQQQEKKKEKKKIKQEI